MRVVYLHQYFNTPDMPGSTRSFELGRELVKLGHTVHMVTTERRAARGSAWRESNEAGIQVHYRLV